jgi:hypothetical protein
MIIKNVFNILYSPEAEWQDIANENRSVAKTYFYYVLPMALIPAISALIGSSYMGWGLVGEKIVKLTFENALTLSIVAYVALCTAVAVVAYLIQWMANTYGSKPSFNRCFSLAAYSASPLFLVGVVALYPLLWADTLLTLVAIGFSVKLLFSGVPIMMDIDKDKAFLFANSILTVCMILIIGLFAITVLFWGYGLAPVFTQ